MTRKRQRLLLLVLGMAALGGSTALVLSAMSGSLVFFYTPSELAAKPRAAAETLRIGGLVEPHSVEKNGASVAFRITDGKKDIEVHYRGVLPDLFHEGQGVVAEGRLLPNGSFRAATVLAKHDENYMPRWVAKALAKNGAGPGGTTAPPGHIAARP